MTGNVHYCCIITAIIRLVTTGGDNDFAVVVF